MNSHDFKLKLARLYEIKKLVCECRNPHALYLKNTHKNYLEIYHEELRERDAELEILDREINMTLWLHDISLKVYIEFYEENNPCLNNYPWRDWEHSLHNALELAKIIHLESLLGQLDERLGLVEKGFLNIFHQLVHIDADDMLGYVDVENTESDKPIIAFSLIFPKGFVLWNLEYFLTNIHKFLDINMRFYADQQIRNNREKVLHSLIKTVSRCDGFVFPRTVFGKPLFVRPISIGHSFLEVVKQIINLYYILHNERILFPDIPNIRYFGDSEDILEIGNAVVANYIFQKYKEELMIKTWKPSRVVDWCFDEEEKADFI